jgi:hypothetical protein
MKITEFAELIGVSRQSVLEAIKRGRLPKSASRVGKVWHVDPELGQVEYRANVDIGKRHNFKGGGRDTDGASEYPDFNESRAKRIFFEAKLAEIEVKTREGQLVDKAALKERSFKLGRLIRDGMLNIPDRVAADIAAETDAFKVHARLTKEIREVLTVLGTSEIDNVP